MLSKSLVKPRNKSNAFITDFRNQTFGKGFREEKIYNKHMEHLLKTDEVWPLTVRQQNYSHDEDSDHHFQHWRKNEPGYYKEFYEPKINDKKERLR